MEDQKISFKQRVEACKEEMQHILPGFMKKISDGKHTVIVESPSVFDRSTFKVSEQ